MFKYFVVGACFDPQPTIAHTDEFPIFDDQVHKNT